MAEIQQLEWLRLAAVEDLARLRLALGEHEQLIPELRRAVAEAPYNEQLWASLMIALARCGKRAEALIAYQHARDALHAELDIEPGPSSRTSRAGCATASGRDKRFPCRATVVRVATPPAAPIAREATVQSC